MSTLPPSHSHSHSHSHSQSSASTFAPSLPTTNDVELLLQQKRYADLLAVAQRKEMEDGGLLQQDSELWFGIELFAAPLNQQMSATTPHQAEASTAETAKADAIRARLTSKFVWHRIPGDLKKSSKDLSAIWELMKALLKGDYTTFFTLSSTLQSQLSSPILQRCNQLLVEEIQRINLHHLQRGYTTLSATQASSLLGISLNAVESYLTQHGWSSITSSSGDKFYQPTNRALASEKDRTISTKQIEELTKYIAHLEE